MAVSMRAQFSFVAFCCLVAAVISQPDCPTPPVVLHSTLVAACLNEPARSSIGCSMYRLCQDPKSTVFPKLCETWRIASSLCYDDPDIIAAVGFCDKLKASYASADTFKSCLRPYPMNRTSSIRASQIQDCINMGEEAYTMEGCDTCSSLSSCPNPLVSYSRGCYSMDMGNCKPWLAFCRTDSVNGAAPGGTGAAVLCLASSSAGAAPPRPPSPPPDSQYPTGATSSPPPPPPASCVVASSQPSCATHRYPDVNITADLNSLCGMMPYMPGCTIRAACQSGTVTGDFCAAGTLLATICTDMPGMFGCKSYNTLCSNTSVVQQCKEFPAIPQLYSTMAGKMAIGKICSVDNAPEECATCDQASCPNYLVAFSTVCGRTPSLEGCAPHVNWCAASAAWEAKGPAGNPGSVAQYCASVRPKPPPPSPPSSTIPCVAVNTLPECATYVYPAGGDLTKLCNSMPYMPGCTIRDACKAGQVTGVACDDRTLLATICTDMPGMADCSRFRQLCKPGGIVPQCGNFPAIQGLPTTVMVQAVIDTLCRPNSPAKQCETCDRFECDNILGNISSICRDKTMPLITSAACGQYAGWCKNLTAQTSSNFGFFCSGSDASGPRPPPAPPIKRPPPPVTTRRPPPPVATKRPPPPVATKRPPPPAGTKRPPPPAGTKRPPPPAGTKRPPPPAGTKRPPPPAGTKRPPPPAGTKRPPPPAGIKRPPPPVPTKRPPPPPKK